VEAGPAQKVLGTCTALCATASQSGRALGPAVLGTTIDLTGRRHLLLNAAFRAVVTLLVFIRPVRRAPKRPRV